MNKNFDGLISFIDTLDLKFSLIGITETWLQEADCFFNIDNYSFLAHGREAKRGGGVALYIDNDLDFKCRADLDLNTAHFESIFVEINNFNKNIVVGVIYRPPNQPVQSFIESFNEILNIVNKENKLLYLMGDFNLNLLHVTSCQRINEFLDVCIVHNIYPLIHTPTRVTNHSVTLLDNIMTNDLNDTFAGVILSDISDHFPVFSISNLKIQLNKENVFDKRVINEENKCVFVTEVSRESWTIESHDVNEAYENFLQKFLNIYESCFPVKRFVKKKFKNKPWFNKSLRKLCNKKCYLYRRYLKSSTPERYEKYKKFRNKVTEEIKKAKKEYFRCKFVNAAGDMKNTWKIINTVLGRGIKKRVLPSSVQCNEVTVSGKGAICNAFNRYFVNIGHTLSSSFANSVDSLKYVTKNNSSMFFTPCTPKEVINIVSKFKNGKSPGFDGVLCVLVKSVIHILCYPLCDIINLSLNTGIVPDKLKIAKVIPVYKKGSKDDLSNYRPISILPFFSKILEKCVYIRVHKFLEKCNIITPKQFGFRAGYSTSYAIIELIRKVSNALDNKEIMIGLFLDLSKAFDSLDHTILLNKLECYGFRGIAMEWFKSYISNRKQYVVFDKYESQAMTVRCGVPQGSILGPLLFLLYVNDICNVSKVLELILFADDTSVFMSHQDITVLQNRFNTEFDKLVDWLYDNKLVLNIKKTNFMTFTNKHIDITQVKVKVKDSFIDQVIHTTFLGITIDNKLTWKEHTGVICNKISKHVGVFYKLKFFPKETLMILYNTLILPHLYYCILIWAHSSVLNMNRLLMFQKKIVRIVTHSQYLAHTMPLFYSLKTLRISDIYVYHCAIFMYLCFNELLPNAILQYFELNKNIHGHQTRYSNNFHIPGVRTLVCQNTIFFRGPKIWNEIPLEIRLSPSLNSFKRKMKLYLLQQYSNVQ